MTVRFRQNPLERDEYGEIPDFEKTWICFTLTVKNAPDERAADDAFEFIEWYLYDKADIPCALMDCRKCENGVYTDVLTFDRDKNISKGEQADKLRAALGEAKAAWDGKRR